MHPLRRSLESGRPFAWRKAGRIHEPSMPGFTHGSHPCAIHQQGDRFVIAFTARDAQQRSQAFLSRATIRDGAMTLEGTPRLVMTHGAPGTFDCDGVIGVCIVPDGGRTYLYYVGWQNLPEGMWICDTGRAILDLDNLTCRREFAGPVLGRDKANPLFAAATAILVEDGRWRTWYNSGISWTRTDAGWLHHYGIHHAHSRDGVDWVCDPGLVLPFKDEHEYAFGRPTVIRRDGILFMWFAHRASPGIATYRIGFAHSRDGIHWTRRDDLAGIDVSADGWDSEMICYPYVFEHGSRLYMLYNGNGYGRTGFGLAVLDDTVVDGVVPDDTVVDDASVDRAPRDKRAGPA